MKTLHFSPTSASSPSFALISVLALVSLAALTATAFLASARLERQATMPLTQTTKLDMALDCGSVAAMRLLDLGSGEQFNHVVTYWRGTNTNDWTNELGYLLIGALEAGNITNKPLQLKYYFCFSSAALTNLGTNLVEYTDRENAADQGQFNRKIGEVLEPTNITTRTGTNFAAGQFTNIPLLGDTTNNRFTSPPVGWVYIKQDVRVKPGQTNTTNVPVTRFAFYVQDLSSMIDAERMGGETDRSTGTNPSEISLTNLTGTALTVATNASNFTSTNNRMKYLTPGMLILSNGGGLNTNDLRYVTTGLRHWTNAYERIPFGLGYSNCGTTNTGTNKFNLNSNGITVDAIAAHITSNLTTNFLARAGGLTNEANGYTFDYAKCLAANIVDYIDPDSTPTYGSSGITNWCGIELAPVVTCAALANARSNCIYSGVANTATTPPLQYSVTETITATLSLQFWNPYDKATPATNVPLEFRTCPPGSESTDGLAYVIPGNTNTPITGNGSYQHFETLFTNFKSTTINIPTIPPNSYALVEVVSTTNYTWTNLSWIAGQPLPTDNTKWGMKRGSSGPGSASVTGTKWRPVYKDHTPISGGIILTRGNAAASTAPWNWNYNDHYSGNDGIPLKNSCWQGYLKIGLGGSLCTMTNLYIYGQELDEDDAVRACWYPNFLLFAGSITTDPASADTNCVGTGDPRISYFARPTNNQPLYNNSPWYRTSAKASGLSWGGRAIVRATPGSDAVKTNKIEEGSSAFKAASLAANPGTWLDSGHADNPFGTNSPYMYNENADVPSAPTYASASNLFAQIPSANWKTNQAPCHIANTNFINICKLGNIFDPIMWTRESQGIIGLKDSSNKPSVQHGGGNTLRIGRPEHARFAWTNLSPLDPSIPNMQQSAAALLDLFCLSNQFDEGGKINLNSAPAPVLRALAGGIYLRSDPNLTTGTVTNANYPIPAEMAEAFAQGVMRFRSKYPFYSPSQLSFIGTDTNWPNTSTWPSNAVFGNTNAISLVTNSVNTLTNSSLGITDWNDQAAEEWFAKIFSLSTVYSRNFRVYVIAQKATTNSSGTFIGTGPVVRKYYNLLIRQANPGTNEVPGSIPVITSQSYY